MHGAANTSATGPEIEVALAVAVPLAVAEQVLEPKLVYAPAGNVAVRASWLPEIVPDTVPVTTTGPAVLAMVRANGPVTVVPLCVTFHVTGVVPAGFVSVPDQFPARFSEEEEGLVLDPPHPATPATSKKTPVKRTMNDGHMIRFLRQADIAPNLTWRDLRRNHDTRGNGETSVGLFTTS